MKRRHRGVGDPQAVDVSPCRPRRGVEVWGPRWYSLLAIGVLIAVVEIFSEAMVNVIWGDTGARFVVRAVLIATLVNGIWSWWLREVCGAR